MHRTLSSLARCSSRERVVRVVRKLIIILPVRVPPGRHRRPHVPAASHSYPVLLCFAGLSQDTRPHETRTRARRASRVDRAYRLCIFISTAHSPIHARCLSPSPRFFGLVLFSPPPRYYFPHFAWHRAYLPMRHESRTAKQEPPAKVEFRAVATTWNAIRYWLFSLPSKSYIFYSTIRRLSILISVLH